MATATKEKTAEKAKQPATLKVKIIGCGGIGLNVLPVLCRYLNFHPNYLGAEITLLDGDDFEERNRDRQKFSMAGGKKATVIATDLQAEFPRLVFHNVPEYLTDKNIIANIREHDVVFSCVDNHKTRKLLSDRAEELKNVTVISGGNELEDGNVQVFIRRDGKNLTVPLASHYHPEIQAPADKNPGDVVKKREGGCDVIVMSAPQLLIMNNWIASQMLVAFYGTTVKDYYFTKPEDHSEFYLDMPSGKIVSRTRVPKKEGK